MGVGDEIMAAGQAEKIWRATGKPVAIVGLQGRPRWHDVWMHNPAVASPERANNEPGLPVLRNAPGLRPYIDYDRWRAGDKKRWHWTGWRARDHMGRIVLTDAERATDLAGFAVIEPNVNAEIRGRPWAANRDWGFDRWQAVVRATPDVRWVQLVPNRTTPVLDGVERVVTPTFRRACGILSRARLYAGHEGGMHHAAAVLGIPGVVVMGGFPLEAAVGYPVHVNLGGEGCGALYACEHCVAAMAAIRVETVLEALAPWR